MSGISGMVTPRGSGTTAIVGRVARMQEQLRHRGPGSTDIWTGPGITLSQQRLGGSDDVSPCPPALCAKSGCRLVIDGQVQSSVVTHRGNGVSEEARSDCTLKAVDGLFDQGGEGVISRLTGVFALAAWQERERRLILARDPVGLKPLCYVHAPDGSLFFASEPKALLAAGAVRPALNYRVLSHYLATQTTPAEETLFDGIHRLPPGHTLAWQDGRISVHPYRPQQYDGRRSAQEQDVAVQFAALFRQAVRSGLRPGRAPGALLSASVGAAVLVRVLDELADTRVRTFSVAFTQQAADELEKIRLIARLHGTDHSELVLTERDFFASLPTAIWHQDEPIAHPSRIGLYHATALASADMSDIWSGAGCDELLAGHPRHRQGLAAARVGGMWGGLPLRDRFVRLFQVDSRDPREVYLDALAAFGATDQQGLLTGEALERAGEGGPYQALFRAPEGNGARALTEELLAMDLRVWLPELTTTHDRMAMAVSIQSHAPFLDPELVEFTAALPARMKLRGRRPYHILRKELGRQLPADLVQRRHQRRQIPVGRWLRGTFRPFLHEYVLSDRALGRNIMRPDVVGHLVAEHESGRADHTRQLWSLINLEVWQRLYLDGEAAAMMPPDVTAAAV